MPKDDTTKPQPLPRTLSLPHFKKQNAARKPEPSNNVNNGLLAPPTVTDSVSVKASCTNLTGNSMMIPSEPVINYEQSNVDPFYLPVYQHSDEEESKFEKLDMIAKGSFGQVWRARLLENNDRRIFALKMMEKSRLNLEGRAGPIQCKLEVSTQNACKGHPYIISIFHCWQTMLHVFIVFEFAPFGELYTLWRQVEVLSDSLAMFYLSEVACALDFIHSKNIVFRDLKMENLLIDAQGHARLTDFGLARWMPPSGRARTICGTLQYTAPEVLEGRPYTQACDWWSLGIMAYAMLCGKLPITGARNHVQMLEWVEKCKYEPVKEKVTSKASIKLLKKLLQKSPKKRLHSIEKLLKLDFFKEIDLQKLRQKQYNPGDYYTGADLKRLPENSFVFHLMKSTLV